MGKYSIATNSSQTELVKSLNDYIYRRTYNTDFCDIIPIILSDALKIDICIISSSNVFMINTKCGSNGTVYIQRTTDHYNSIIPVGGDDLVAPDCLNNISFSPSACNTQDEPSITPESESSLYFSTPDPNDVALSDLTAFRCKHKKQLVFGNLNINSVRSKIGEVTDILNGNTIDIFSLCESKLNSTFPDNQFKVQNFNLYRADRTHNGGGVMCYVRSTIPHRIRTDISLSKHNIETLVIDVREKRQRAFYICVYRSPSTPCNLLITLLQEILDKCLSECDTIYLMGDLNVNFLKTKHELTELLDLYDLKNVIKDATCFKSVTNPSLIDIILTNKPRSLSGHLNVNIGLSDFHNITCASTKHNVTKLNRSKISYRSFKKINEVDYLRDIQNINTSQLSGDIHEKVTKYISLLKEIIDKHAPMKTKCIKDKQVPYMHDNLRKAINVKAMLFRKYIKNPNDITLGQYKSQRNKVNKIKRTSIKQYFENKCQSSDCHSKSFWETIKPFFSNKNIYSHEKINLLENDQIVSDTKTICSIFNDFFVNITKNIAQHDNEYGDNISRSESIMKIREYHGGHGCFNFTPVSYDVVCKKLKKLNPKKASGYDNIPSKLIKIAATHISKQITPLINESIVLSCFPDPLKYADVSPIFKKSDNLNKENFRPVSVLTILSKIFEGIMADQMKTHFNNILSEWLSAYRSKYSCNNVLLCFAESLRKSLDNNKHVGCVLMDLSKAFDCLNHDILIQKLAAYNVSNPSCEYIKSYLSNRKQRVKLQNTYSPWKELTIGVPQGSILGPLLFNIFINDIFLCIDPEVSLFNYADDNTLVYSHVNKNTMIDKLERASQQAIRWFKQNNMKANPDKFQTLYLSRNKDNDVIFKINDVPITPDQTVKLLGIHFDDELTFSNHVSHICKKAGKQVNALRRLSKVLDTGSKLKIYNSFIQSAFSYCPTVYNTFSIENCRKLEKIQERALRFVFDDYSSSYNKLLEKASKPSVSKFLITNTVEQVFKVIHDYAKPLQSSFFLFPNSTYDMRNRNRLQLPKYNTTKYGKHSFQYMGSYLWNNIPDSMQQCSNINDFKEMLSDWEGPKCKCGYCFICL
jgi:hypothetical protein